MGGISWEELHRIREKIEIKTYQFSWVYMYMCYTWELERLAVEQATDAEGESEIGSTYMYIVYNKKKMILQIPFDV